MANYMLCIEEKRGSFREIDWTKIASCYESEFHTLKGIDSFSTCFNDEEELKEILIIAGLIKYNEYEKRLVIRYKSKGELKNLTYGLAYAPDRKFLDPEYCAFFLKSKANDIGFMEKLCNHYRNSYIQGNNINAIRCHIDILKKGAVEFPSDEAFLYRCLSNFVVRECYNYDASTNRYKTDENGRPTIKYKGLHDLALFIAYDLRAKSKVSEKPAVIEPALSQVKEDVTIEESKPKVKKKSKDFPGQMNFEDYLRIKNQDN